MLTPEQQALRLTGIGSSDVPSILGLYPATWKEVTTAEDILAQKLGDKPAFEGNARTRIGERLEPYVAQWWAEDQGQEVTRNPTTARHPEHPWALATADYFTREGDVLEVKVCSPFVKKYWNGEPAPWVWAQVQFQLFVLGKARGYVAAHIQGDDELVRSYPVAFDPVAFKDIFAVVQKFWARVEAARAERAKEKQP